MAKNELLKKKIVWVMLAAQERALRTYSIKFNTNKTPDTSLCRLCGTNTETIIYITSESSKLAQKEHQKRQNKVALRVNWDTSKKYGLKTFSKWYEYQPLPLMENDGVNRTREMTAYTDKKLNRAS